MPASPTTRSASCCSRTASTASASRDRALARGLLARARAHGRFGVDEKAYPADFATSARYHSALRALRGRFPLPPPLRCDQLETFLAQSDVAARAGVTIRDAD